MTRFQITSKEWVGGKYPCFYLDGVINYEDGSWRFIICENSSSFNDLQKGDYLEIDTDKLKYCHSGSQFGTSIVRKYGSSAVVSGSSGGLTISTTPSSAAEVARTVTQTVLDHADRTGGTPQIEIGTDKTSIWYHPPKK